MSHHLTADAAGAGLPDDDLAIMGVDGKRAANNFAIPAGDLQPVR